jgi:hypothetical protein
MRFVETIGELLVFSGRDEVKMGHLPGSTVLGKTSKLSKFEKSIIEYKSVNVAVS